VQVRLEELRAIIAVEIKEAAESGDAEKAERLVSQMDELEESYRKTASQPTVPSKPSPPPDMIEFLEEQKDWITKDEAAALYFAHKAQQLDKFHPNDHMTVLEKSLEEVKKRFPDLFKTNRKAPTVHNDETAGGEARASGGNGIKWQDLPAEAKEACKRMEKQIPNFTRDRFLKSFDLDEYNVLKRKQERI